MNTKSYRIFTINLLLLLLTFLIIECRKEDAWHCMDDRCCSVDFSKMLTTVDFILYACANKLEHDFGYSLYFDNGEEMDFLAYYPYTDANPIRYCGLICEVAEVCFRTTKFEVTDDDDGTAEWCFEGTVIVKNETLYEDDNVCLSFHKKLVDIPERLEEFMQKNGLW